MEPGTLTPEQEELVQLITQIPPSEVHTARRFLKFLVTGVTWPSLQNAPVDDEPYTDEEKSVDAGAMAAVRRGEAIPFEELKREFGL